ncbi:MAG: beta-lactamase hydrolase domain-containing protein [Stenotrophobium sp.]
MTAKISLDIPNAQSPAPGLITGGRPAPAHFSEAKRQGVTTVVNLCPPTEACAYDEAPLVTGLGLRYVNIPVAGADDLTPDNARRLADALAAAQGGVLVHCASGNRVGALFALKARHVDGKTAEESLEIGRAAGLKAMEPVVRQLLGD